MANSRMLVGFSFVGTTLAAVIALFWFWNRKDVNQDKDKPKRKNDRSTSVPNGPIQDVDPEVENPITSDASPIHTLQTQERTVVQEPLTNYISSQQSSAAAVDHSSALISTNDQTSSTINVNDHSFSAITENGQKPTNSTVNEQRPAPVVTEIEQPISLRPCYMKPKSIIANVDSKHKTSSDSVKKTILLACTSAENVISQSKSYESSNSSMAAESSNSSESDVEATDAGICRNRDMSRHDKVDLTVSQQTETEANKDQVPKSESTATSETIICEHSVAVTSSPLESSLAASNPSVSEVLSHRSEPVAFSPSVSEVLSHRSKPVAISPSVSEVLSHRKEPVAISPNVPLCDDSASSTSSESEVKQSENQTPVVCTESESGTSVLIKKLGSSSDECCNKTTGDTVSELLSSDGNEAVNVDNEAVNVDHEGSQAELKSKNSGEIIQINSCSSNESLDPETGDAFLVNLPAGAETAIDEVKSNSDLQTSVSLDSLEMSPEPEGKSQPHQSLSNSCESETFESACREEISEKGDNTDILVSEVVTKSSKSFNDLNVSDNVECTRAVVNEATRNSDCDKTVEQSVGDREPSQSTESGLSRDSLEPLESCTQTATLMDVDSEQTIDDDSGLQLTPSDSSEKTVVTPEKSEGQGNNCDNTSEASNDSGKGASVGETIGLPQQPELSVYQIDFPTELCGRLIGRYGRNINHMKEKTGAVVTLRNNPFCAEYQICTIEGLPHEIEETLAMMRQKFPKDRFPNLQLAPTNLSPDPPVVLPDLQMNLPHGVSVDVIVSSIVNAGLVFLQQPTHPTFPSLERLNQFMLACYTQDQSVPQLPRPVEAGVICAAPVMNGWFRAMVVDMSEDGEECDIKFVDYGGYSRLPISHLRQIRSDFMTLPFQAVECYMANVTPIQGEMYFNSDGASVLEELTQGKLLQAQVVGRAEDGIPFVHIYQVSGNKALFVNREMVNRGVARWIEQL